MDPAAHAPDPDDALMARVASGDRAAFAELVQRHQGPVRALCARQCGAAGDDVAQEAFAALWEARRRYQVQGGFRAYLYTLVLRRCQNQRRGRARRPTSALMHEPADPAWAGALDGLLASERAERVHAVLTRLPEPQREALLLRYTAELDYAEIAAATACPPETARSRVFLGLARLREIFRSRGEP